MKNSKLIRIVFVGVAAAVFAAACSKEGSGGSERRRADSPEVSTAAPIAELQKIDVVKGSGEGISAGQQAVVHYTGWLYERGAPDNKGKPFDSSRASGRPFRFVVGVGNVIKVCDEAVQGMQPGGRRQLVVPADLGYGARGAGGG